MKTPIINIEYAQTHVHPMYICTCTYPNINKYTLQPYTIYTHTHTMPRHDMNRQAYTDRLMHSDTQKEKHIRTYTDSHTCTQIHR